MNKTERHKRLCDALNSVYIQKNHDYGDSFHQTFLEEGFAMARIRMTDKLNRFKALTRTGEKQKVTDESLTDTLLDLANYALMTVLEIQEAEGADAGKNTGEPGGKVISRPQAPIDVGAVLFHAINSGCRTEVTDDA